MDTWVHGCPDIHGKPERQFLFTRYLEVQLLEFSMKMEIFLHEGDLLQGVSISLIDYLLHTKY